jgi:AcrR family transcriptional regulator
MRYVSYVKSMKLLNKKQYVSYFYDMDELKSIRRRGDELMESVFDATFKLMNEVGHTNLTFQQIADAAKTSRTVLYRRWPTTFDLLQDVYTHKAKKLFEGKFFEQIVDNGSLRLDLLQLLTLYQRIYEEIGAEVLNNYFYIRMQDKTNMNKPGVHVTALEKHLGAVEKILEYAKKRGEKIKAISKITLMLPFDLIRIENLARIGNINNQRLEVMVDEVLLPVFKN